MSFFTEPVAHVVKRIQNGEMQCAEIVARSLETIQNKDNDIHAFISVQADRARDRARFLDSLDSGKKSELPLVRHPCCDKGQYLHPRRAHDLRFKNAFPFCPACIPPRSLRPWKVRAQSSSGKQTSTNLPWGPAPKIPISALPETLITFRIFRGAQAAAAPRRSPPALFPLRLGRTRAGQSVCPAAIAGRSASNRPMDGCRAMALWHSRLPWTRSAPWQTMYATSDFMSVNHIGAR